MTTLYLICFVLGFVLSLLGTVSGLGRFHVGHLHVHGGNVHAKSGGMHNPALNGFTLAAFLCWFGGVGYLLDRYSSLLAPIIIVAAAFAGAVGAFLFYTLIFKLLLPRERVLSADDTRMEGTLARVSDEVRAPAGIGEILFSQAGTRRSAPARSEDGSRIARDTEVVVLRYERGVAFVRPLHEFNQDSRSINL